MFLNVAIAILLDAFSLHDQRLHHNPPHLQRLLATFSLTLLYLKQKLLFGGITMHGKMLVRSLAAALAAAAILSGCNTDNTAPSSLTTTVDTTESTIEESTTEESTSKTSGIINHGHSITEDSSYRKNLIDRSDVVLTNQDEALEYLETCVERPGEDFKFVLTDTSENDPGAYMWYEFTVSYKDIFVMNSEFKVITFTDGTLCEGNPSVFACIFADSDDVINTDEALKIYAEEYIDDRDYVYLENIYYFRGKANTECMFLYKYKYDCGKFDENNTILLDAKTGEMVGCWPDAIT